MSASLQENDEIQLSAYCDGELDPASVGEFERRLASDALLKARHTRLLSLRRTARTLPKFDMPSDLAARIQVTLKAERQRVIAERPNNVTVLRRRNWSFQALAASALIGAVISGSALRTIDHFGQEGTVANEVVAGHIRSLLASQPFDIASSDRHTVKPWFTARLPESPQVPDLAAQGFPLIGGRVDVIDNQPVATIVYKHAAHTVSLTTLRPGQTVREETIAGYNVRSWSDANFTYVAVGDLPGADLAQFERDFSAATQSPEVK